MDITKLQAETRESRGTREARRIRKTGKIPAVIYGHGETPENVSVSSEDFTYLLMNGAHLVELDVAGKAKQVLIKDVQYDHLGKEPIHVDFTRVDLTERVQVSVPIEFKGVPAGESEGGVFEHTMGDIEIECLVTEIPESIRINVSDMHLGDILHVSDVKLPPNMSAVSSAESIVCSVRAKTAAAEVEEEGEEEGAEGPEIIGKEKKEEEGQGE